MSAFINRDGAAVEVFPGIAFVDRDAISRPSNWLELATPEELAGAGIVAIAEPPAPPAGKIVALTGLVVDGEAIVRAFALEDAPPPPAPEPYRIAKADLWRRASEAEAEAMDAALNAAPVRLRRAYEAAAFIASDDEWFGELRAGITAAIGAERAAELLAASA